VNPRQGLDWLGWLEIFRRLPKKAEDQYGIQPRYYRLGSRTVASETTY
jgi:hypothetical protein